jgi:SAM-dependent methyltransferase
VQPEAVAALLSDPGRRLLDAVTAQAGAGGVDPLSLGTRLRRKHDPALVAAVLTQVDLRGRAVAKLGAGDAARMFLTPEALEQATPARVAAHRAARLAHGPGAETDGTPLRVTDLGCGIGADLVALARAGLEVTGVERDPVRAALARANLAALGLPGRVVVAEAEGYDVRDADVVFADPARRDARGRVFDPAAYSPPWSFVQRLLLERAACVKISPALPHRMVPTGVEAEWVSDDGEVKEATLWSPALATTRRRATLLPSGATVVSQDSRPPVGPVGAYLLEPDGAVVRAGLVGEVAARVGARLLDPRIAYLTADEPVRTPLARGYAVVEQLPYREKTLRAALRRRDVGALTIKKRGVEVTPEVLRRRLALRGDRSATLVLTRTAGSAVALLVEPL